MANKSISGDVNVKFTEAQSRQSLESGESVKTLFGKLRKWLTDLGTAAFTNSTDYAAASHNQPSSTITSMTGYSKPQSTSAIAATDTLNEAIGKLEKGLDGAGGGLLPGNVDLSTNSVILSPTATSTTITLSNATGECFIMTEGTGFEATLSGGGLGTIGVFVVTNGSYSAAIKAISVLSTATWADASDEMVAYMIQAHRNGTINLSDYWTVGDVRTITNLDKSTITSNTLDLVLLSGIPYVDNNNQSKQSKFKILVNQNRSVNRSTVFTGGSASYSYELSTSEIANCLPSSLNNMLLSHRYISGYTVRSQKNTYDYSKYTMGGQYIGETPNIPVNSNRYYASNDIRNKYKYYAYRKSDSSSADAYYIDINSTSVSVLYITSLMLI